MACFSARSSACRMHSGLTEWKNLRPIAEILELEQVLHIMGIDELDASMRDFLLPFLAKTKEDRKRLTLQDGFASLVLNAKSHAARMNAADVVGVGT